MRVRLALILGCFAFTVLPARAALREVPVADLSIKKLEATTYIGEGVIAPDGSGETALRTVRQGHTGSFNVKLVNPGAATLVATLKGCRPDTGFLVKYFVGSANVSKSMKAGTLSATLGVGASIVLRVDVIAGPNTHVGRVETCPVSVLQSDVTLDTVIGQATVRS